MPESSRTSGTLFALVEGLFSTLFPSACRFCNAPLENISRLPVCRDCLARAIHVPTRGPSCFVCGERVMAGRFTPAEEEQVPRSAQNDESEKIVCGMCERHRPPYERALAYGPYDGALRDLVHLLKYARVHTAAPVLGRMLAEVVAGLQMPAERVLVVPVPLYQAKLRQRGFNQALEVTRAALRCMLRPPLAAHGPAPQRKGHPSRFELQPERLLRVRDTASQTGLTRYQRRENVRGAFVAVGPESLQGATVLLVDDVFTTGTTVTECAKVLRRAGAGRVYVATVARVLKHDAALLEPDALREDEFERDEPTSQSRAAHA